MRGGASDDADAPGLHSPISTHRTTRQRQRMPGERRSPAATRAAENRLGNEQIARRAGLVYVDDRGHGIRRRGSAANGFSYLAERTRQPVSGRERSRIRSLAIPPAYRDVWICPNPRGHLQASGRDRSEEHTSELQSQSNLVCRLLLEKKK